MIPPFQGLVQRCRCCLLRGCIAPRGAVLRVCARVFFHLPRMLCSVFSRCLDMVASEHMFLGKQLLLEPPPDRACSL